MLLHLHWQKKPLKELNVIEITGSRTGSRFPMLTNTHTHQTPPPTTNQSGATHIVAVCKCRHTRRERRGGCREDFLEDNVGVKDRGPHPYTTEGLPLSPSLSFCPSSPLGGLMLPIRNGDRERASVEEVPVKRERKKMLNARTFTQQGRSLRSE